ncbi:MAG TPA: amidohydrolase, partial [Gemmatimonadales bacterium]|nr:amidohydrolase [Gemmatimonadales bacterium]
PARADVDRRIAQVLPRVVEWRRDIHQHPELSNREVRTARLVADHLTRLGLEVKTGVAHTGVVGVLRGGRPGPVVALRADMDALPVTEQVDLPFKSTARAEYNGQEVGVMHACGHDNHVAILMGVAEVLAGMKATLPGTVKFIFQPAEEGPPAGEDGGAKMMIAQGVLADPAPAAIFGLHAWPTHVGTLYYRPGGAMAAADGFSITVKGRQTHGSSPWGGVDPVTVAAQITLALQLIPSRQTDVTKAPVVVTVGSIHGGNRGNIIPDSVVMVGTIRTFDEAMRKDVHERIRRTAQRIAESQGATALVTIPPEGYPVTHNDPALVEQSLPVLRRVAGDSNVVLAPPIMGAEDFSEFQKRIPGFFFFLGVTPRDRDPSKVATNHSPFFFADEGALPVGVGALTHLTLDWLARNRAR